MPTTIQIPGAPQALLDIIAARRARIPAGMTMVADPPEPDPDAPVQPDGVSDSDWAALGDPGKRAIVRERERATTAERDLAALRATLRPKPTPPPAPPKQDDPPVTPKADDIAALISAAVEAAIAPLRQEREHDAAEASARRVVESVSKQAEGRFIDPSDALGIDMAGIVDDQGQADVAKVTAALDALLRAKPHLAKPATDDRRRPGADAMLGGTPTTPEADRVKSALARMQSATGVKLPAS